MSLELGCQFASTAATPEHIRIAEELGYRSAWCFYSPAIYADPWMTLARAADRTSKIRLGSLVVPRLRHVLDIASSLATLEQIAPGRALAVVGSGFSSVALMGGRGLAWATVEKFIVNLRGLLAGDTVDIDGFGAAMLHSEASGIRPPVHVPIWVAAAGAKSTDVAARVGDGIVTSVSLGESIEDFPGSRSVVYFGTVLESGEDYGDPAVIERTGPTAALGLHLGPSGPFVAMPEGSGFLRAIAEFDEDRRVVETHRGHMISMTDADRRFVTGDLVRAATRTGNADSVRAQLDRIEKHGSHQVCFSPTGPDIIRELESFAQVFHSR